MNEINFLPSTFVARRVRKFRIVREAIWIAVALLVMTGWYVNTRGSHKSLEIYAASIEAEAEAAKEQKTEVGRLLARQKGLQEQMRLQRDLGLAVSQTAVMGTLAQLMPPAMALTDLHITAPHPTPAPVVDKKNRDDRSAPRTAEPAKPAMLKVEMVGLAPSDTDVADFVGKLSNHPLFTNVKMLFSRATQAANLQAREFRIELEVPLDRDYQPADANPAQEVAHAS